MADREVSDAAEHETFPGPGPLRADEAKRGIHPVEQMVDAAIDRIAREQAAARDESARKSSLQHALALASTEGASTSLAAAAAAAAASASTGSARRANARLRWKGLDVSDEFRSYADRVARGEDLPPFKGKILAEPDAEFPWDPKAQRRAEGRALKRQFGLWSGVALFLGLSVWVLVVQVGKQTDAPRATSAAVPPQATLSTTVLSNQPVVAPPRAVVPQAELAAGDPQPTALRVQPEASAPQAATPSPAPTTALASLQERGRDSAAPVAVSGTRATGGGVSAASVSAASVSAASVSAASVSAANTPASTRPSAAAVPTAAQPGAIATPAGSAVGVFVATRSPSAEPSAPGASVVGAARTPPSASSAVPASIAGAAPAATAPAANAADPASPGGTDPATAAHADPKKEPGREASAMGPLLVETPSF